MLIKYICFLILISFQQNVLANSFCSDSFLSAAKRNPISIDKNELENPFAQLSSNKNPDKALSKYILEAKRELEKNIREQHENFTKKNNPALLDLTQLNVSLKLLEKLKGDADLVVIKDITSLYSKEELNDLRKLSFEEIDELTIALKKFNLTLAETSFYRSPILIFSSLSFTPDIAVKLSRLSIDSTTRLVQFTRAELINEARLDSKSLDTIEASLAKFNLKLRNSKTQIHRDTPIEDFIFDEKTLQALKHNKFFTLRDIMDVYYKFFKSSDRLGYIALFTTEATLMKEGLSFKGRHKEYNTDITLDIRALELDLALEATLRGFDIHSIRDLLENNVEDLLLKLKISSKNNITLDSIQKALTKFGLSLEI